MNPLHDLARRKVEERKRQMLEGKDSKDTRDLISLMRASSRACERTCTQILVRANMSESTPPDQKMREDEIIGQLCTFMFAGSDTTA